MTGYFKIALVASVTLAIGFVIGLGIKIAYESTRLKQYDWMSELPVVVNCYGEDFSELQMIRAIDYWTVRGHSIGFYEHNPPKGVCDHDQLLGFIMLKKKRGGFSDGTIASTTRKTSGVKMKSATIWYSPGSFNLDLINEHELGHAFGYGHVEIDGHLMHPLYSHMGQKFWVP